MSNDNISEPIQQKNYRTEYNTVSQGYRFFVSIRFITVAFAVTLQSMLLTLYNQIAKNDTPGLAIILVGIFITSSILIVEWRTILLFREILKRGIELEFHLGLQNGFFHRIVELSTQHGWRSFITHTWGINILYSFIFVLWFLLLATILTR